MSSKPRGSKKAQHILKLTTPVVDDGKPLPPLSDPVVAEMLKNEVEAGEALLTIINDTLDDSGDERMGELISVISQKHLPSSKGRSYRIDVLAKTVSNEYAIYEVSLDKFQLVNDRSFTYAEQILIQNSPKGSDWDELVSILPKRVIVVNILDFTERKGKHKNFHQVVEKTYREEPREVASDRITVHNLELPKFRKTDVDYNRHLHCWLFMLTQAQDKRITLQEVIDMEPKLTEFSRRPGVKQFVDRYELATASPAVRNDYFTWIQSELYEQENLRLEKELSHQEGIEIGEQKMRNLARMMRSDGKPEDEIKRYTGYTFKDLDSLK